MVLHCTSVDDIECADIANISTVKSYLTNAGTSFEIFLTDLILM